MCDVHAAPNRSDQEKLRYAAKEAVDAINSSIPNLPLTIIDDVLSEVSASHDTDVAKLAELLRQARDELKNGNIDNAVTILSTVRNP